MRKYIILKRMFSLILVIISIFTLSGFSCFACEKLLFEDFDEESSEYYNMEVEDIGQIYDIYGDIDMSYYIDYGDYYIIVY